MDTVKKFIPTLFISLAIIISGGLLGRAYVSKGKADPIISVAGMGEESFDSDLIVWKASFSRQRMELKEAYSDLNMDLKTLKIYFKKKGVDEKDIIIEAASISKDYSYTYDDGGNLSTSVFNGYVITQKVKIRSKNVDLIEKVSREVSELIDAGIELNSESPEYYYTKLAELKLKMIESATKDAHLRAKKIAENGDGSLGNLRNADLGVFQITAENSSEDYEWGGSYNTSSRRKTANIIIRLKYEID